jgi:hypothetical protein
VAGAGGGDTLWRIVDWFMKYEDMILRALRGLFNGRPWIPPGLQPAG